VRGTTPTTSHANGRLNGECETTYRAVHVSRVAVGSRTRLAALLRAPTLRSRDVRLSFFGLDYRGFGQFRVITVVCVLLEHQFFLCTDGRFVRGRVLRCI
jgi:hypothetical protein